MGRAETFDAAVFKDGIRREWRDAAPGWRTWYPVLEDDDGLPQVGRTLIEHARLESGHQVLDVGAGYGEPGLTATRAVSPGGRVIFQDISADMLAFARERAGLAHLDDVQVEFRECDAEELELDPGSLDAIISRAVIMYLADPSATLRRLRPMLKPGGRLVVSTWAGPDKVGFAAPVPIILDMLELPPPPAGWPGLFALSDPAKLVEVVTEAGFDDVRTGQATAVLELLSPEDATRFLRDCAPPITALVDQQPPATRDRVWQRVTNEAWTPFVGSDGQVRLPNEANWVAARNPT